MAVAEPASNPITSGHLIMPKAPEEPGRLVRGHPTPAELGISHMPPWLPWVCGRGSAQGMEMAAGQGISFRSFVAWPKGCLETPWPALLSLQRRTPHRQCHPPRGCCCLHWATPACCCTRKLAERRETRKAMPLPGERSGQLLTWQHLCAVLTYHLPVPRGLAPSPALLWAVIPGNILESPSIMPSPADIYRASSSG